MNSQDEIEPEESYLELADGGGVLLRDKAAPALRRLLTRRPRRLNLLQAGTRESEP